MDLSGIHFMMPTPFNDDGSVDEDSIASLIECALNAGCTGVVCLGIMGEAVRLSDEERRRVVQRVTREAAGRLTVTVGTTAPGMELAVRQSVEAQQLGADAVMAAPPPVTKQNLETVFAYFQGIAASTDIDLVVQDHPVESGVFMPPVFIQRLSEQIENAHWLKLEERPTPSKVTAVKQLTAGKLGIFGGLGGVFLLEELARGACGTMTGFAFPEVLVNTYRLMMEGKKEEAAQHFFTYLPLIRYESQEGIGLSIRKEILKERGFLKTARVRHPGSSIDEVTRQELFRLISLLGLLPDLK